MGDEGLTLSIISNCKRLQAAATDAQSDARLELSQECLTLLQSIRVHAANLTPQEVLVIADELCHQGAVESLQG